MAETPSTRLLPLGSRAPEFELPDAHGRLYTLDEVRGPKGLMIMFVCNHCPYVVHLAGALADFAREAEVLGVGMVAINSNDAEQYPADAPHNMPSFVVQHGWTFPYLVDADQGVAKSYVAACTPDFYLFDGELRLVYCGQFDSSRPKNAEPVTGADLREALRRLCAGEPPLEGQRPSTGYNIKWRAGKEPQL